MINLPIHFIVVMEALRHIVYLVLVVSSLSLVTACLCRVLVGVDTTEDLSCLIRVIVIIAVLVFLFALLLEHLVVSHIISQSAFNMLIY